MAEKKKMTVAEILAAARKKDGGSGGEAAPPSASADTPDSEVAAPVEEIAAEESAPAAPAPQAPAPKLAPGQRPNVADILAMARSGQKPEAAKPAEAKPKPKAEVKPAAKPAAAAAKAAPAGKAAPKEKAPAPRLDTTSILGAARGGHKPGPVTKAEAPAKPTKAKAAPAAKLTVPPLPEKPQYAVPKPAKPVAAKPAAGKQADPEPRRNMMFVTALFGTWMATGFTMLATVTGLWTLALARFMFPNMLTEPPSRFKVGFPDEFPPGQVSEKFKAQFGVWVVNAEYQGKGEIFALASICTHLGCTPNWLESEQKFKCPCHGSGFYKDGINFEGPAPRPLERYSIRMAEDGQLEIDKSRKFQEELGQWEDGSSFVNV